MSRLLFDVCLAACVALPLASEPEARGDVAVQARGVVVVDADVAGGGVDAARLREAIGEELGEDAVAPEDPRARAARGTLRLTLDRSARTVVVSYRETGAPIVRQIELPADAEATLRAIVNLAGNLARDEASELLSALGKKAPAQAEATEPQASSTPPNPLVPYGTFRHRGLYIRVRVDAFSYTSAFGDGPTGSASVSSVSGGGALAVGGSLASGLVLGGEVAVDSASGTFKGGPFAQSSVTTPGTSATVSASSEATAALVGLGILVDWFPDVARGWHFGGSIGLGGVVVDNQADGSSYSPGINAEASLFGGLDFWIGPGWSLGVALYARAATPREELRNGGPSGHDTGYRLTPVSAGPQVSFLYY